MVQSIARVCKVRDRGDAPMTAAIEDVRGFRAARALVCLLFFTFAMTSDAVGSIVSRVIAELHLSLVQASAFQYVPMAAIAVGAVALGYLADRLGRKLAIIGGLALYGGSSLLFAFGNTFGFFVALLALSGVGISLFKTGALALIGDVSHSTSAHTRLMNAAEGFFGVGSIVGPAIVAALLSVGLSWKWLYVAAATICMALIVLASRANLPRDDFGSRARATSEGTMDLGSTVRLLKDPFALGFATLIMLYVASESAVYVWMPTYVRSYRGSAPWLPIYGLTIFFILRALGRFVGIWLLRHLRWSAVLAICGLFIFASFLGSITGGLEIGAWLLPVSGIAMSVIYPTLNSKGISCFPRSEHGAAAGVLLFFTAIAAAIGPLAMGSVSDSYGTVRAGFVLATAFAFLLSTGLLLNWAFDPTRHRLEAPDPSGRRVAS
jgi:MFS transporter, DHA1 family, quinolone resistance protein